MVDGCGISLKMLLNEKKPQEIAVGLLDKIKPGQGQGEKNQYPQRRKELKDLAPPPYGNEPDHDDRHRENNLAKH